MGQQTSLEEKKCGYQTYPGYNDHHKEDCMDDGWITKSGPTPNTYSLPENMKVPFVKSLTLAREACEKRHLSEDHVHDLAWHILRWAFFDREGDKKDIRARLLFLNKYVSDPKFHMFLDHNEAWQKAKQAGVGRVIVYMDNTVPGNINFNVYCRDDQGKEAPKSAYYNVDEQWVVNDTSITQLACMHLKEHDVQLA